MASDLTGEPIQIGRQHVLQGERLVSHQEVLITRLRNTGQLDLATEAETILHTLRKSLTLARADLAKYENEGNERFLDLVARQYARFSNKTE